MRPLHECDTPGCPHVDEWCDRNRGRCDALIPGTEPGTATACGQPTVWLAPITSFMFPLAYCSTHRPREDAEA